MKPYVRSKYTPLAELLPISVRISCTQLPIQESYTREGAYNPARSVENYCEMIKAHVDAHFIVGYR